MALEARNLWFRYEKKQSWILEDFSLRIEKGERIALLAPSGRGKTTLAKLLAGYEKLVKGEILWEEKPLPLKGRCPVWLIGQHPEQAVNPHWRMKKVLEECGGVEEELLDRLGISQEWLERFPGELSGGELQRFCVARALRSGARYLICDEVSSMLDTIMQAQLWQVIMEEGRKQSMGVMVITHNPHLATRLADRQVQLPPVR